MKATLQKPITKKFPVELTLTLENQDDLDILGGLSNSGRFGRIIRTAFPKWRCPLNWEEFRTAGAEIHESTDALEEAAGL